MYTKGKRHGLASSTNNEPRFVVKTCNGNRRTIGSDHQLTATVEDTARDPGHGLWLHKSFNTKVIF